MTETATATRSKRLIGWNDLQFHVPPFWEVIVSGPRHLLIECDFQPVLELRWHIGSTHSPADVVETTTKHFAGLQRDVRKISPQKPYTHFAHKHKAAGLSWNNQDCLDGLIWQCSTCNTVIFCHLFQQSSTSDFEVASVLESFHCCHKSDAPSVWSIQDFQLSLPPGFSFVDHSFKAGLSRLAFTGNNLQLQFCRLAPAATRLKSSLLPRILTTLQGEPAADDVITDTPELYECRNIPSTSRQLLSRLRRRPLFRWGRIWHDAPNNRLLSVLAESPRPIDHDIVHELCTHYEIISFN